MALKGSLNQGGNKLKFILALGSISLLAIIGLGIFFTQASITGSAVGVSDKETSTTIKATTSTLPTTTTTLPTTTTTLSTPSPKKYCSDFGYFDYCYSGFTCQEIKPSATLTCCQCVPVQASTSTTATTMPTTTTTPRTTTTTIQNQYQNCIRGIFDEECRKYSLIYTDYSSTVGFITCTDDGVWVWGDIGDETKYIQVYTPTRTLQISCGTYIEPTGKGKCIEDYFEELCHAENLIYTDYSSSVGFITCTDDGMYIFGDIGDSSKYEQVYISQAAIDSRCP